MKNIGNVKEKILSYIRNEGSQSNVQIQIGMGFSRLQTEEGLTILVNEGRVIKKDLPKGLQQLQSFDDEGNPQLFWYELVKSKSPERIVYTI